MTYEHARLGTAVAMLSVQSLPEISFVLCPPGTQLFRGPFFCAVGHHLSLRDGHAPDKA
jgi:hypothetical protein